MKSWIYNAALLASVAIASTANAATETYVLDGPHTSVVWVISHFGFSHPAGKFANITGTLMLDHKNPKNSSVDATIPIDGLATGVALLDEHLKSEKFFDVKQFPTAHYVSKSVDVKGSDAVVHGTLTMHGVSKPLDLAIHLNKEGVNMMQKQTAGFSGTAELKRSDYGMTSYLPGLGDDVTLTIESEANLKQ